MVLTRWIGIALAHIGVVNTIRINKIFFIGWILKIIHRAKINIKTRIRKRMWRRIRSSEEI